MFKRFLVSQLTDRLNEPRRFIQIIAGPRECPPDQVGAYAGIPRRIAAAEVRGVVAGAGQRVGPGAEQNVGIIVHAVAIKVHGAGVGRDSCGRHRGNSRDNLSWRRFLPASAQSKQCHTYQ